MVKIFSVSENYDWISKIDVIVNPENMVNWVANESRLYKQLQSVKQCIVLLPNSESYEIYSLCSKISKEFPLVTILLVFNVEVEFDMKRALRAGADDVIFLSTSLNKIKEDINLAIENSGNKLFQQLLKPKKNGRVISVCSTKGGIGKTTIAVNLAASYGKKSITVAVMDLNLQFGDIAMFLDLKPELTIYDWVKEDKEGKQIENYLTDFRDGISVLAAPQRPEFAEVITGDDVRKALTNLKQLFDVVIIDASSYMNEIGLVALENSDDILLLTYLDLPTLKNSKLLLDTLVSLRLEERVKIVLNRQTKVLGITTSTIEKVIGKRIFAALPVMEKAMLLAVNEGKPLSYSHPKSQVSKRILQMAETLYSPQSQPTNEIHDDEQLDPVGGLI
ncbi:CpaE family protein [Paenisporosarcina macmurdoensis]|uniref:CpaE family protein n=1 Tax=Paenisporosarcina macmurdoensis TaxID=212659 RepID=A0ABW1L447_9BACL